MDKENIKQTELLNDLIAINTKRIKGYNNAITWIANKNKASIQKYFEDHRDQSIQINTTLKPLITLENIPITDDRLPIDYAQKSNTEAKTESCHEKDLNAILIYCQQLETETTLAYIQVIVQQSALNPQLLSIIESQASMLLEAHKMINKIYNQIHAAT